MNQDSFWPLWAIAFSLALTVLACQYVIPVANP